VSFTWLIHIIAATLEAEIRIAFKTILGKELVTLYLNKQV
jgi:hypothetical protein